MSLTNFEGIVEAEDRETGRRVLLARFEYSWPEKKKPGFGWRIEFVEEDFVARQIAAYEAHGATGGAAYWRAVQTEFAKFRKLKEG